MGFTYIKNEAGEFLCQHCKFTAKNQSTMHYHLKKHEGVLPHPCKHCSERFAQKSRLDIHIRLKHSETLEKKETFHCPCVGCSQEDIRKGNRLIHFVRIHLKDLAEALKVKTTEEKCVTACSGCKKSFKSMTQFQQHASECVKPTSAHPFQKDWVTISK